MKQLNTITIILLLGQICFGQTNQIMLDTVLSKESFWKLNDSLIKNEIVYFNLKGASTKKKDTLNKILLNEIPINTCTDSLVHFYKGNIFVHIFNSKFDSTQHHLTYTDNLKNLLLLIDNKSFSGTNGSIPQRKVDSIILIMHSHFLVKFPDSAYSGIYEPHLCDFSGDKKVKYTSSHYKVFQSPDKRRLYIYMLNGEGAGKYEVTWVIQDGKYYTRVLDYLMENFQIK
jgi:hypothetical protein